MQEAARRSRMTLSVMLAVAAAVAAMVMMAVPVWAASKVLVSDVSPDGGASSVAADSDIKATFSRAMKASSIKGSTFYLKKVGSSTAIPAQVSYSGTNNMATLNPGSDLEAGTTYTATIKGGKRGVKASGGGLLGGTTDSTATFANRKVTWGFTVAPPPVDTEAPAAPSVHLDPGSNSGSQDDTKTNDTTPTIGGTAEANSTVKIYNAQGNVVASVTAGAQGNWSYTFGELQNGSYNFTVKATNAAGKEGNGSSLTLVIDNIAPNAPVISSPADNSYNNTGNVTVSGTAEANSTVELFDDTTSKGITQADAQSNWSKALTGMADGSHIYTAKAKDAAGNTSGAPNARTVIVDTVAPDTTIDTKPNNPSKSTAPSFGFSSTETGSTFECKLDQNAFASCTSPKSYSNLAEGTHIFQVRAIDAAGNTDPTPASHTWTVDTVAPTVSNISPANTATGVDPSTNVTATFSEAMNSSSISGQTFSLKQGNSSIGAAVTYNPSTRVATLEPSSDLAANTTYTATITTGVKDLAGNVLAQERSLTFTTGDSLPDIIMTPNPLTFSASGLCLPQSNLLEVKNNGSDNVTFAEITITGPDAARFSSGAKSFLSANGPFTLQGGNNFFDEVTFVAAGGPPQPRGYEATLTYKDGTGATIGTPVRLIASSSCIVVG